MYFNWAKSYKSNCLSNGICVNNSRIIHVKEFVSFLSSWRISVIEIILFKRSILFSVSVIINTLCLSFQVQFRHKQNFQMETLQKGNTLDLEECISSYNNRSQNTIKLFKIHAFCFPFLIIHLDTSTQKYGFPLPPEFFLFFSFYSNQ